MATTSLIGRAVFPDGVRPVDIMWDDASGLIVSVTEVSRYAKDTKLIFPGFIDAHVHAREFPRPENGDPSLLARWEAACRKETLETAGQAAINGGVAMFAAMPNDPVPPANPATYAAKVRLASASPCPVIFFASITRDSEPWADLPYKAYLDTAPGPAAFSEWADFEAALARYRGCQVFIHAEDPEVLRNAPTGPRWISRPPEAEISAVRKVLELADRLGIRTHICHVSTRKAVELITEYNRTASLPVTCEVTPHHLFFSVADGKVSAADGRKVFAADLLESNPPLRSEDDRRFLVDALRDGRIDMCASDHAPHTIEDKRAGAPGMPHLDTLGAFAGRLMTDEGFSPARVAVALATAPAGLFASDPANPYGRIEPGAQASFTVLDLDGLTVVEGDIILGRGPLRTRCGWSPFRGIPLPTAVAGTVIHGKQYRFG